jgi:hypothetical protein
MRFSTPQQGEVHYDITTFPDSLTLHRLRSHVYNSIFLFFRWVASPTSGRGACYPFSRRGR